MWPPSAGDWRGRRRECEGLHALLREGVVTRLSALAPAGDAGLRWFGDRDGAFRRGHGGRLQPQEEGAAQLLSSLLHGRPTSMIPMGPTTSFSRVSLSCGRPCPGSGSRSAWTAPFSVMRSSATSTPRGWSILRAASLCKSAILPICYQRVEEALVDAHTPPSWVVQHFKQTPSTRSTFTSRVERAEVNEALENVADVLGILLHDDQPPVSRWSVRSPRNDGARGPRS